MGLFDFIEQDDAVWMATHFFGELASFIVTHIARRRTYEAARRMLLAVFAHIHANQGIGTAKHPFGQGAHQVSLTHTR